MSTVLRFWAPPDTLTHVAQVYAVMGRGEVEDTRLEAKAKDTKKIRGQG